MTTDSTSLDERLKDPDVQHALHRLLDRLDKVEALVDSMGTFGQRIPVLAEAAGDLAAQAYDHALDQGIDPYQTAERATSLAFAAAHPDMLDILERLLDKRTTLVKLLDTLEQVDDSDVTAAANALVEARRQPPQLVGPFAALFRLGDPDIQRAIGFSLEVAKRLGQALGRSRS